MLKPSLIAAALSPLLLAVDCGGTAEESQQTAAPSAPVAQTARPKAEATSAARTFVARYYGRFNLPWAAAFAPGTNTIFITEKPGAMYFLDTVTRQKGTVTGLPVVDFGIQGGLGDVAFLNSEASETLGGRTIYLTWAEAGEPGTDTRGAAMGRGDLACDSPAACRIENLEVIWRQFPKVNGRGHYSHRIAFSPDEQYLFLASGERQNAVQAQNPANNLGKVLRLNLDGTPAAGNVFSGQAGKAQDIWTMGHRNPLGLAFDLRGRLWDIEHGPDGGDELNLIVGGKNYGWPEVSEGNDYDGTPIPRHSNRPGFRAPAEFWTPVIAPGGMIFYRGTMFPAFRGQAIIAGMKRGNLIRVALERNGGASEIARHEFDNRIREVEEAPDGAIWLLEDAADGRLIRLTPAG